ncbi:MAG: hypothetical protein ACRCZF_23995, partial [Gemmataceae bacterium]
MNWPLISLLCCSFAQQNPLPTTADVFLDESSAILKRCQELQIQKLAILRFQVSREGQPAPGNVGTLNQSLTRMLERSLVLGQPKSETTIQLSTEASRIAAKLPNADFRKPDGQKALLAEEYPSYADMNSFKPDGILVGLAVLNDSKATIALDY